MPTVNHLLDRPHAWATATKLVALALAAFMGWGLVRSAVGIGAFWRSDWREAVAIALLLLIVCLVASFYFWIAWRLWADWSAATVRLFIGAAIGLGAMIAWSEAYRLVPGVRFEMGAAITGAVAVVAITLGVLVYRKLTRAIIRRTELPDPFDAHGHPQGHMQRVKLFCTLLGWSVGWTLASAGMAINERAGSMLGLLVGIGLGIATYKLALWWMTPPTSPALPPGGFEIFPDPKE